MSTRSVTVARAADIKPGELAAFDVALAVAFDRVVDQRG